MTAEWRFIQTPPLTAAENMAIDEAILLSTASKRAPPTFRIYSYSPGAVSLGYFQGVAEEVNVEECQRQGVDIIRRLTGGGTVLKEHPGGTTYGVIASDSEPLIPRNILESYRLICGGLVRTLANLGLEAEFKPINDVCVNGKKISGNAQTRRHGGVLQHGTLLIDLDVERMFTLLKVPDEKLRDKAIASAGERVTSLKHQLGRLPGLDEANAAMARGFAEALGVELVPGKLDEAENADAERLVRERYGTREWNFKR